MIEFLKDGTRFCDTCSILAAWRELESIERQLIKLASKVFLQGIFKYLVFGGGIGKQSHRRSEFQVVWIAEDLLN